MKKEFTVNDTNFSKGIAMCLMIMHHLFWNIPGIGLVIGGMAVSQRIGIIGKVCVAIFVILSGYGLNESIRSDYNIKKFYKKHLSKIYINYWFIVLISFFVGVIFFRDAVTFLLQGKSGSTKMFLTFTGLHYIVGYQGFNPSWWYITLTVILYILFPLVKLLIDRYNHLFMFLSLPLLLIGYVNAPVINISMAIWLPFFILGIYMSKNQIFIKLSNLDFNKYIKFLSTAIIFVIATWFRSFLGMTTTGVLFDIIFAPMIIIVSYLYLSKINLLNKLFVYIGKHSFYMYLLHMFVTNYYIGYLISDINEPILMFLASLIITLLITLVLEKIENSLKLTYTFSKFINRDSSTVA